MCKSTTSLIIAILGLFLLPTKNLLSAEISIQVKEKGSGVPIEGATVVLMNSEDYQLSLASGLTHFVVTTKPKRVKIIATGYKTQEFLVKNNNGQFVFYIEPINIDGEGIEIVGDRIIERISKIKLSGEELNRSAGTGGDPLKAINSLPGIVSSGEESAEVYMRGSGNNDNVTWINGAPVGYLYHFGGMWSTINPSLIEDINVFSAGFQVEYEDALGGVIDAKLRAPRNDRMHYKFDLSTISGSFLIEGPASTSSKDSFFVAGRRSYFDLIFSPEEATKQLSDDEEENPDRIIQVPRFHDFQALYRHQINNGYVDAYYFSASDKIKVELNASAESDPQLAGKFSAKADYQTTGVSWNKRFDSRWSTTGTAAYVKFSELSQGGSDENGIPFNVTAEQDSLYFRPELQFATSENSKTSLGTTARYIDFPVRAYVPRPRTENDPDFDFTSSTKYNIDSNFNGAELSPYIKYHHKWNGRLTTTFGLRSTNIKFRGGYETHDVSPRASVEYSLLGNTRLMASWGRYLQMPAGAEIIEKFGNPNLVMTEAEHRIIGVEHKINSTFDIRAEIYHKPMKNLVLADDNNAPPNLYQNTGSGEAYGIDIFLKRKASNKKFGWLAVSWAESKRTNNLNNKTRDFSGDQPLTITALWGQAFKGNWNKWDWSIKAQAHSGQPYTQIIGRHQEDVNDPNSRWIAEYGEHNAERLPDYFKLDVRFSRNILFDESKMKVYLDIQNITAAKNIVEYDYGKDFVDVDKPTEVTGISFFPFIGAEIEF